MNVAGDPPKLETAARPCPVCGASAGAGQVLHDERFDGARLDRFAFAARKVPELMHWRLVECSACGLLFASPAPAEQALAIAYRDAGYDSREEARYAALTYGELLRDVLPHLPQAGGALDVGAGDGAFLGVLRALGFEDLVGVEPSRAPVEAADPEIRPLIREGVFRASDFERGRFRLASCLHTVEHLTDPVTAFRDAYTLLREGGALFVVGHDRRAPVNRLLGRRSPIYDIQHLQLFCPRSLRELLARAGFRDVLVRPFRNRYPLRYWLRSAPLGPRAKHRLIAALDRTRLGAVPVTLPVGNLAAVAWKHPSA